MFRLKVTTNLIAAICFTALFGIGAAAQSQPDSQAGAQLGEQSALGGKQGQGANTQKTTETSGETTLIAGTAITAELTNALDSKKVKQGDAVNARTTGALKSADGRTILPKGTKLTGRVTQASARGAGQADSSLGLVFDKAIPKTGPEIPLNVAIQAVAAPQTSADGGPSADISPMGGSSRGQTRSTMGGAGSTAAGTVNGTTAAAGGVVDNTVNTTTGVASSTTGAVNGAGQLTANSRGVVGLNNLSLNANAGAGAQGSVISSTGKNVHLDSGTRLLLVAQASSNQSGAAQNTPEQKP
jgi:hypothetical protein